MAFERAKAVLADSRFADLRWVATTGSTNADVVALLADGSAPAAGGTAGAGVVLVADHQTAGRGRLDRTWEAPPGSSVLMSVGLPLDGIAPERRTLLTSALALAVTDAVAELRIKWPNDLVAVAVGHDGGDRKVGGILAEAHAVPGRGAWVVIGLGLNVNWPAIPDELSAIATSLNLLRGAAVDRDDVVAAVLSAFDRTWLPLLAPAAGAPTGLLDAYRERSATLGRPVRAELPSGELVGTAVDVEPSGALVVEDADGRRHTVTAGDVVHLRPTD
jgi:BirA family transcriptional regulator, biotin operon repressor / biotin---[acetyl-CoA-carboxylase] ligase